MPQYRVSVGPLLNSVLEIEKERRGIRLMGALITTILEEVCAAHLIRNTVGEQSPIKIPFEAAVKASETYVDVATAAIIPVVPEVPVEVVLQLRELAESVPEHDPEKFRMLRERYGANSKNKEPEEEPLPESDFSIAHLLPAAVQEEKVADQREPEELLGFTDEKLADGSAVETTNGTVYRTQDHLDMLRRLGYTIEKPEDFTTAILDRAGLETGLPI